MCRPANPGRDGIEPFQSYTYVDDGMLIEPDIGRRPELSAMCYEQAMELVLGPGAVSQDKKEAEGKWDVQAVVLGLMIDTETQRLTLPPPKLGTLST